MNNVKVRWIGKGKAPVTVSGAGYSIRPYIVQAGTAEVDKRDLFTILNRRQGEWEEVKHVSRKSTGTEDQPDTGSVTNGAE